MSRLAACYAERVRFAAAACVLLAVLGCAGAAEAQSEPDRYRLRFPHSYRPFQAGDYVWTGGMLAAYAYLEFGMDGSGHPKWDGPILYDEQARAFMRVEDPGLREHWIRAADVGFIIAWVAPWATATVMPLADRFNWRVALQLNLMNAQSFALAGFMARIGHVFVGRQRPDRQNMASFPAGHATGAFVGAGTTCVHHLMLGLFGHIALDASWCAAVTGVATMVAVGREAADRHFASDTLAGFLVGASSGVALPLWFHYFGARDGHGRRSLTWNVVPATVGSGLGVSVLGAQ